MVNVANQIHLARQNLLDLTLRNRLINYKPSKARTIRCVDEMPREIYDILILQGKDMEFIPREIKSSLTDLENKHQENEDVALSTEEASKVWTLPNKGKANSNHTDKYLQTALDPQVLSRRLFYVNQQAVAVFEEQGYTILYLALAFVEWTEADASELVHKAPLILVPVELERKKAKDSFKLKWTEEDVQTNISLKEKFLEQGINLPDFEMPEAKTGIDKYLQSVSKAIEKKPKWKVTSDIFLDFFSFTKFVMYRDLDEKTWPKDKAPSTHPLIKEIIDPSSVEKRSGFNFTDEDIDEQIKVHDVYHVMDADPSQIAVIEEIKAGYNLVVEGPPGTGKSQTITNVIAELLASGKTVLFVSEKMAALEVVKSRLDRCGLGDYCLELHSRKSNKKVFLQELQRTLEKPRKLVHSMNDKLDQLNAIKRQLNAYASDLRNPHGSMKVTPFELFELKEKALKHFSKTGRNLPRVIFDDLGKSTSTDRVNAILALKNLSEALPLVRPIGSHPWLGCSPGTVMPSEQDEIKESLLTLLSLLEELLSSTERLVAATGINPANSLSDIDHSLEAACVIASSKPIDREVLLNPEWNNSNRDADELIAKIETFQHKFQQACLIFKPQFIDAALKDPLNEYRLLSKKFFRIFNFRYRENKKILFVQYLTKPNKSKTEVIADIEGLIEIQTTKQAISSDAKGKALFGSYWKAENSDVPKLKDFSKWIVSFRHQLIQKVLSESSVGIVQGGISEENLKSIISDVENKKGFFLGERNKIFRRIGLNYLKVFKASENDASFSELKKRLNLWKSEVSKLQRWTQFASLRDVCLKTIAKPIAEILEIEDLSPDELISTFEGNYADSLLRQIFSERPSLANFEGSFHENKIKSFVDLDNEVITKNRSRLSSLLKERQPIVMGGASRESQAGVLLSEFNRQRGLMPIRKLLFHAGSLVQKIKPCFMMSPLSIAQFLDPKSIQFDVIVFDEASQVKPEDSLGALLRGKQLVVMGDSKQLPPTSFFDHMTEVTDDENSDESAAVVEVESILHQCKRSFNCKTLKWHYRSRHESLIAVSNQEFYDNQLLIYPSSHHSSEALGLSFVHLPQAVYDRGKSSVNIVEAKAVAQAALEHYKKYPNKTLGVGTFNIKQQQAILEQIEFLIQQNPDVEAYFKSDRDEHFFVKNLETIQGDERDVIILSVGFGFDANHQLSLNFGPLNQEGGERRLNVLITRAREKCMVFANFRASDLKLESNAPFGLRSLKVFLDYAEHKRLQNNGAPLEDTDSPFEDAVYDSLRGSGYEVHKQVGCARFRVDLAVVDHRNVGRYLLGIECDGYKYHSSPVARDRDRLRQQILESQGWSIYRIWSTDWYRNRKETEIRLLQAVGEMKSKPYTEPRNDTKQKPDEVAVEENEANYEGSEPPSTHDRSIHDLLEPYKMCRKLSVSTSNNIHETETKYLVQAIMDVVKAEAPVYWDEVVLRVRSLWGLGRSGSRIQDALEDALKMAKSKGLLRVENNFLWPTSQITVKARRRDGEMSTDIDHVCHEEIGAAIEVVLRNQHATAVDDLSAQTAYLFGIKAVRDKALDRIKNSIKKLISEGKLERMENGMIGLGQT